MAEGVITLGIGGNPGGSTWLVTSGLGISHVGGAEGLITLGIGGAPGSLMWLMTGGLSALMALGIATLSDSAFEMASLSDTARERAELDDLPL